MLISTQHLMPQAQSHVAQPSPAPPATIPSSLSGTATPLATDSTYAMLILPLSFGIY